MKRLCLLPLLLCPSLAAADDCTLSATAIVSQLEAAKLPKGAKLGPLLKRDRLVRQDVAFADGTVVSVQLGGCQHLGFQFEIRSKQVNDKLTVQQAVALLRKRIPQLPLRAKAHAQFHLLESGLTALDPTAQFPASPACGDASCNLLLENEGTSSVLVLSYDFAL